LKTQTRQFCFLSKTAGIIAVLVFRGRELLTDAEVSRLFKEIKKSDLPQTLHPVEGFGENDRPFYKEADVNYKHFFSGPIN
jgi:hypothetical protein